uniref:Uncharacterized protein n=1 Tax=Magallana gigas TaxID=29159 RepID=A0A8W8K5G1_MAGGI
MSELLKVSETIRGVEEFVYIMDSWNDMWFMEYIVFLFHSQQGIFYMTPLTCTKQQTKKQLGSNSASYSSDFNVLVQCSHRVMYWI